MDELDVLLRKNKLDIMIIKASHEVEKKNVPKAKIQGLTTLMDIIALINELQEEIRGLIKENQKLKYENIVSYKNNAILKADFAKYKKDLLRAEMEGGKNG